MSCTRHLRAVAVNHTSVFSGAEADLIQLVQALHQEVDFTVLLPRTPGRFHQALTECGIASDAVDMPFWVGFAVPWFRWEWWQKYIVYQQAFKAYLSDTRPDFIHCNSLKAAVLSVLSAGLLKIPLVWHMHDILNINLPNKMLVTLLGRRVTAIIGVSEAVLSNLVALGAPREKCHVIYNARYTVSELQVEATMRFRHKIGVPNNVPLVGMLAQISPWKGQHVFLEAAAQVARHFPATHFVVVGSPLNAAGQQYESHLKHLAESLGLAKRVSFCEFDPDVADILSQLDVCVHASIKPDPLPIIVLEALMYGCPVVATNVGGVPEVILDGKTGFLVPPEDPELMAERIGRLLQQPNLKTLFRTNGWEHLESRLNPAHNLSRLKSVYRTVTAA